MEATVKVVNETQDKKRVLKINYRNVILLLLAFLVGYIHYKYVSTLFENDRNFSHLSELEREMSLRTEMGFYYSYYKTIIEERPLVVGFGRLMHDTHVEYPKEVNALSRFNIYPEVLIGALYRYLEPYISSSRECHMVYRGEDLPPVESCVGIGQPIYFYLEAIWVLAGVTTAAIFLFATSLSESIWGGLFAVAQYFANHAESTRVQWAPNERENLCLPLLLLQTWLVSEQLRTGYRSRAQLLVALFLLNCMCLLFWQFTQFIFLTQTFIVFVMEQLRIIDINTLGIFTHSHFCGLHMSVLLLQGNDMLETSLYTAFFLVVSAYFLFFSTRLKVVNRFTFYLEIWLTVLRIAIAVCASLYVKKLISNFMGAEEDSHIWEILLSKFTDYKSFHTLIYTCSEVFDFLPLSSIINLCETSLIPCVLVVIINLVNFWAVNGIIECVKLNDKIKQIKEKETEYEDTDDSGIENNSESNATDKTKLTNLDVIDGEIKAVFINKDKKYSKLFEQRENLMCYFLSKLDIEPRLLYLMAQVLVYGIMALLVMRLKLLFTTHMCIMSSLFVSNKYFVVPRFMSRLVPVVWATALVLLLRSLYINTSYEMSHIGEFSDVQQEELLQWIKHNTSAGAAFAGSMPLLATIMLCTRRPIVAHPHYEHHDARLRAYTVYKTYGRFSAVELYQQLSKLRATYLVVETQYCYGRSSGGCSYLDIWDVETPELRGRPSLCHSLLMHGTDHLYPVFRNRHYAVFRLTDYQVQYMPRSFDT